LEHEHNKPRSSPKQSLVAKDQAKQPEDCLICRLTSIQADRADVVQWLLTTNKSKTEKIKIASLLTGLKIDKELLACLEDPSIARIFSTK